ncbi:MAG TPA: DUF262 domain-containing protein [Pirellulaceae bacterium]|nr:DUF262 domain-containing protein [Pirellulaceae bacterium]
MKSFDSRVYSIITFVEWEKHKQLELNSAFQRRAVWSEKAKSYLMDTIIRGKPIPKVFIRQKINVSTKLSVHDVIDGQQRLRTILSYIKDGFVISKQHHPEYGGLRFSQLPEDVQSQILSYEVSVDLLINLPNSEVLDIFSRLNSYAVILNEQEKLNAKYFGAFKVLADNVGRKYFEYWRNNRILSDREMLRMAEITLVADLMIAMLEGIKAKRQISKFYGLYEKSFDQDVQTLEMRFDDVIGTIAILYPEGLSATEFSRPFMFYSLFTTIAHCLYTIPNLDAVQVVLADAAAFHRARNGLDRVGELFEEPNLGALKREEQTFLQDSRRATTDESVRKRRTEFLLTLMR